MHRLGFMSLLLAATIGMSNQAQAVDPDPRDWNAVLEQARGQTVYWNAWGGEQRINDFIQWAGDQVKERHGINVVQVKLSDTADAVSRVLAEKTAGTTSGGAVDLIWINGENFAGMKRQDLLFGPWAESLPNFMLTDPDNNPAVRADFTVPVDGFESPWGKAQIAFYYDSAALPNPPRSMKALLDWAKANPGRFTYPIIPDFLGTTFLKQALIELAEDDTALYAPVSEAKFDEVTAPLWHFLDQLHPYLWRQGRDFPTNGSELRRLFADGETLLGYSFDPSEASAAIAAQEIPETTRTFVLDGGTIGNVSFVAIPFNAAHKEGAMVLANFLLSPEAQARKQDPAAWGNLTVLAVEKLRPEDGALFDALDRGPATITVQELGVPLPEPHPGWVERLEQEWQKRYGVS